jgi:hypothetical protein
VELYARRRRDGPGSSAARFPKFLGGATSATREIGIHAPNNWDEAGYLLKQNPLFFMALGVQIGLRGIGTKIAYSLSTKEYQKVKRTVYMSFCLTMLCLSVPGLTWADDCNNNPGGQCVFNSTGGLALTTLVGSDGTVLTNSTPGTSVALNDNGITSVTMPDPSWIQSIPGNSIAEWISNTDSGYSATDGGTFQNLNTSSPIFDLSLTFTLDTSGTLALQVWADDSSTVTLSPSPNSVVYGPNGAPASSNLPNGDLALAITSQSPPCSGQVIGCTAVDGLTANYSLSAGSYTLTFSPYQTGTGQDTSSNPFGLLYSATVTAPEVGTPLLLAFMGFALFAATKLLQKRA